MSLTLHAATIPNWLQILAAGKSWLDKAADSTMSESDVVEAKLIDDMWPFAKQVALMAIHSKGAVEAMREGVFRPDFSDPPATLEGLRGLLDEAIAFLESVGEDEMQGFVGQPMRFEIGDKRLDFTAEDFLLTFSQTNFFFHAVTAYDILRMKGIPVGKLDYLGRLRLAQAA